MTQRELLQRLNQLTLRYNLTWFDIRYDADKAISKINNFMGTKYPNMSEILVAPESTYTLRSEGVDVPIFPTEYIHSVVIPYIASEVLARDEEFTTIYNKYMIEIEEGLFHMFQREFNRVPYVFRQHPDRGVLFPSGSHQAKIVHNSMKDLPRFKFRIKFYPNNPHIVMSAGQEFPIPNDTYEPNRVYDYDEDLTLPSVEYTYLSSDGTAAYTFVGWTQAPTIAADIKKTGDHIKVRSDLQFYAVWDKQDTLLLDSSGTLTINNNYRAMLTNLEIPETLNGRTVSSIDSDFILGASLIKRVVLPGHSYRIKTGAFDGFIGDTIIFAPPTSSYTPRILIEEEAFPKLAHVREMYLPEHIHSIGENAFSSAYNKHLILNVAKLEQNIPDTWEHNWYIADATENENGSTEVRYGYHG